MILVSNHTFLTMQNPNFDLRKSLKAYFYKIWDKEVKYIILVNMKCGVDLRQKQNRLFVSRLFIWGIISKHNYVKRENNLSKLIKIFMYISCEKATQMEHWPDSRITVSISVLYCIALYIFIIVTCTNKSKWWLNMITISYPAHLG